MTRTEYKEMVNNEMPFLQIDKANYSIPQLVEVVAMEFFLNNDIASNALKHSTKEIILVLRTTGYHGLK